MDKPSEWYFNPICKYRCEVNEDGIGLSGNEVHVIEYSAYQKAVEALKKVNEALLAMQISQTAKVNWDVQQTLKELGEL